MTAGRLVVHPLTWLGLLALLVLFGPATAWIFVLSLACHELAHVFFADATGIAVERIRVYPFGAALDMPAFDRAPPAAQAAVALGGPLSNVLLIALALIGGRLHPVSGPLFASFVLVNGTMATANLLPALPLDGGRILEAILCRRTAPAAARRVAEQVGYAVAALIAVGATLLLLAGVTAAGGLVFAAALLWALRQEAPAWHLRRPTFLESRRLTLLLGHVLPTRGLVTTPLVPVGEVMAAFRPERYHRVLVVDASLRPLGELTEEDLRQGILAHGWDLPVGRLLP